MLGVLQERKRYSACTSTCVRHFPYVRSRDHSKEGGVALEPKGKDCCARARRRGAKSKEGCTAVTCRVLDLITAFRSHNES